MRDLTGLPAQWQVASEVDEVVKGALVAHTFELLAPGLAIHVCRNDGYREEASSRAFPGWRSQEIYRALTEDPLSVGARRALERTALAMGESEGTRPEDDPFTHALSRKAETRGRMDAVAAALRARGIAVTSEFTRNEGLFARLSIESLMAAALACTGEDDFRQRIREDA